MNVRARPQDWLSVCRRTYCRTALTPENCDRSVFQDCLRYDGGISEFSLLASPSSNNLFTMDYTKLKVGRPISRDQFDELTDEQLERLVPKAYREYFPVIDAFAVGHFYLHDGTAWSFYKGGLLDD